MTELFAGLDEHLGVISAVGRRRSSSCPATANPTTGARAGQQSITVTGRDWPLDGLQLVEVDPLTYDRSIEKDEEQLP